VTGDKGGGLARLGAQKKLAKIGKVILVGSGKGGVGKSLVACGLGLLLAERGHRTGILDADLHGASVPDYVGARPPLASGAGGLLPKESGGLKVMSVSLLTGDNPVPVRGAKKEGMITELFALTDWGRLDFLVVDLPPSTGDELLTAFSLFARKSTLVLVTTPSPGSLAVVSRLRRLAASEGVPVAGVVLNMAFTGGGEARNYPFGRAGRKWLEERLDARLLAEVPLDPAVSSAGLKRALEAGGEFSDSFGRLASRLAKA